MNSKTFSLFALSILSLVLVMSFASAATTLNQPSIPSSINQDAGSFTFTFVLNNTGASQVTLNLSSSTVNPGASISFDTSSIAANSAATVTATVTFPINLTTISGTVNVVSSDGSNPSLPFSVTVTKDLPTEVVNCFSTGNPNGNLKINSISFTNNGLAVANMTFGDDKTWFPFENINAKVDVKSTNSSNDLSNIEVDWGIWDTQKQQWIISPSELKNIDLSGGKTKSLYQSFSIDNNMDASLSDLVNGNYQFYITASGQDSNSNNICAYKAQSAKIAITSDFVVFTKFDMPPTVQCGQNVQVTGQLWNIGRSDQNSVSVDILGSDPSLQLSKNVQVGDITSFDNKQFSFSFTVPGAMTEGPYSMKLDVLDENGNIFQENNNNHYSEFLIPFTVQGGCSLQSQVSVAASIVSGGQAGKPMQVKTTITNTGTAQRTYTVQASGYETWASSASVNQGTITLTPGQSLDVLTTFNVNSDATGTESYSLDLTSGTQTISQPVSVNIQSSNGFLGINSSNALVWVLGLLILILVIVIIIVAVRSGRKK